MYVTQELVLNITYRNCLIKHELDKIIKSATEVKFVIIYLTKCFQKKLYFSKKKKKPKSIFEGQVPFEGKGGVW